MGDDENILHSELLELEDLLKSTDCTVARVEEFYQNGVNTAERMLIWKWLLGVSGSTITDWETPVAHKDIDIITDDVLQIADMPEDQEKMIKILSYYCTARNARYKAECGWAEVLLPLATLSDGDMYACFYALISKFVPRNCKADGKPFHLFRLLLLYHDPELCAFLDTKKCSPDLYAQRWFRSLYVGKCEMQVVREMWSRYLLQGDPFMVFYLALVILVNAREVILEMESSDCSEIAKEMTSFPDNLSVEDIEDFITLAKYYGERTPLSFRHEYHTQLFGNAPTESHFASLSQALCLPIPVSELLQISSGVRYLVVDCRSRDQYDSGHLPGAIHLDPDAMLTDPALFTTNVATVLLTQRKTYLDDDLSSNHLCFMGAARGEDDQLLNMVIAHFLHRKTQFVSSARNGYKALHDLLDTEVNNGLEDHNNETCAVCCEEQAARLSETELIVSNTPQPSHYIVNKMTSVMKVTSSSVRNKLGSLWAADDVSRDRHVTTATKSRPYRGMENVFSIADDEDEEAEGGASSSEESSKTNKEIVNIKLWESMSDILHCYPVSEITMDGGMYPSVLMVTATHLYNIRRIAERDDMGAINFRYPLFSIARITAKKKHPDVITFKFLKEHQEELLAYRFLIPNSKTVTSQITQLIPPEQAEQ